MVKPGFREGYPLAATHYGGSRKPGRVKDRIVLARRTDVEQAASLPSNGRERGGIQAEKRPYRRFTQDEDARIEALRLRGLGFKKIGRLLHRPRSSVQFRLRLLAELAELRLLMEVTNNGGRNDRC